MNALIVTRGISPRKLHPLKCTRKIYVQQGVLLPAAATAQYHFTTRIVQLIALSRAPCLSVGIDLSPQGLVIICLHSLMFYVAIAPIIFFHLPLLPLSIVLILI